ncbi:MAG: hypothetical protein Q9201_000430 [Fulgogasparrea decipioides]
MISSAFLILSLLSFGIAILSDDYRPFRNYRRAAYFQDNDPAGSSIVALEIEPRNGTLSSSVRTSTGGKGLAGLVAVSQDSVVVSQDYLFATNAGDNTLSLFLINPNDPLHPKLVGTPAPTLGQTPVSVAYSPQHRIACAVNGGSEAGVACFGVSRKRGLILLGSIRTINQTENLDPTPPPAGPLVLTSDIVFNPSSTALFVTVRSNGLNPGLLYAFAVDRATGAVSQNPVVTSLTDLPLLFSINFLDSDRRMIVTNPHRASPGAAVLNIDYPSLKASVEKIITIPGQKASCWVAYTPEYSKSAYVVDAGQPNITVVDPRTDEVKNVIGIETDSPGDGGFDTHIDRKWLYLLTKSPSAPKVEVFAIESGGTGLLSVQSFDIFGAVGRIPGWMGLAIWPSSR